jgi:dTMP kinase
MSAEMISSSKRFLGRGLPYINAENLHGQLVVIEGSDGVGRSTQVSMLRNWLEVQGAGVAETGWTRSMLMSQTIDLAKEGHKTNRITHNLLYASDFADRLEHEIIPALRAGFVVLADRYVYTAFARALVRGGDPEWIRNLYGFALEPDLVFYLQVDVDTLINRRLLSGELDYWEVGLDQNPGMDPYDSFIRYQTKLLREFNRMAKQYGFKTVDARRDVPAIQLDLRREIARHLGWELTDSVLLPDNMTIPPQPQPAV